MPPFRLVATFRQQVHVTCQIARVEVFWVDPRQQVHVLVLGPQLRGHPARPVALHVIDQAADEIGDQVRAQGPARPEIAEDPDHAGHAGKHHAAIGDRVGEVERLTVDLKGNVAKHAQIEPGSCDDDVCVDIDTHFTPNYRPWRQRITFIPDGDFLQAIRASKASVVTGEIETLTESGLLLKSGKSLAGEPSNIVNKSSNGRLLPANLHVNPKSSVTKGQKMSQGEVRRRLTATFKPI
jgi:hypothetical protein